MRRGEKGAAVVEMAIVTIILAWLAFGVIDVGRALFTYVALRDSAQEGVVYGQFWPRDIGALSPEAAIERRARENSTSPFDLTDASQVAVSVNLGGRCVGAPISVTVSSNVQPITPLVQNMFPTGWDLSATVTGEVVLSDPFANC